MRRTVLIVVAVVLVIGLWKLSHRPHPGLSGAPVGKTGGGGTPAPNFSLQDLNGQALSLAKYHGRVVLLDFWATWCGPCREEIPQFVALQDRYRDQGLQVIGISMDDGPKPVRGFYREFKMNYPVALGTEQVAESYGGVMGLPVTFLIDRDGRLAAKYDGAVEMATIEHQVRALLQAK